MSILRSHISHARECNNALREISSNAVNETMDRRVPSSFPQNDGQCRGRPGGEEGVGNTAGTSHAEGAHFDPEK